MFRCLSVAIVTVLAAAASLPAKDGDIMYKLHVGYHRNICWPHPFNCPDRASATAPFATMTNNGWRRHNLLGQHHFEPDGSALNVAGQLKVRWILTQAPPHRRSIFVERDLETEVTDARIAAVDTYSQRVLIGDEQVDIQDTHLVSEGRSASIVDAINVRFQESMPPPILPASTIGGGSNE